MNKPTKGVIAAGHPKTAEAGALILQQGGNAFDAATAAVLAAWVTESVLTSAAGGGFLLAHTTDGQDILFDFFTQTPQTHLHPNQLDFYPIKANFGDATQEFHIGLGSMAVPGNLKGVAHVHQRLGRLPFAVVAEPAIQLAQTGVVVNPFQGYCYELLAPILMATEGAKQIYAPQGTLLRSGDVIRMPDLADTLTYLVTQGVEDFYQGAIAHQIESDCRQFGGYLTCQDLGTYRVIERQPLKLDYRGLTLLTNPPPSSGGSLIAFTLSLLSQANLSNMRYGSRQHLHILIEAMRLTNAARRDGYDANLYQSNIAEFFLSASHMAPYHHEFHDTFNKWGSTTHISVIDADGNAASVTSSNGEGSSYVIPGTGIMVNNMLGEEDLNPHGFHQWQPNRRISSMMAPTIVLKDNQPYLVLGSGGSNRIRTAILQVISNVLDFGMPLTEAVQAARIHWERGVLNVEPGFDPEDMAVVAAALGDEVIGWQNQNMFFGGVHAVMESPTLTLSGSGDPRRNGAVQYA